MRMSNDPRLRWWNRLSWVAVVFMWLTIFDFSLWFAFAALNYMAVYFWKGHRLGYLQTPREFRNGRL